MNDTQAGEKKPSYEDDKALDRTPLEIDTDSLHILPLSIMPIETPTLKRAKMIKNVRLDTVVEIFEDASAGSGQMMVEDLAQEFNWPADQVHPDLALLRKLALLPSYDVYSLRILVRDHGIPVNDISALRLSSAKNNQLTSYMTKFTRPLIMQIYGDDDVSIQDMDDIVALFKDPDVRKARDKLKVMADKLDIGLADVPKFLEDYGDIFLSLSYYRQCLDYIEPIITNFIASMDDLRSNWQARNDAGLMKTCNMIESVMNNLMANITGRFESFDRATSNMWDNLNADRFRRVENLITNYHTTIGGVLCAMSVKMDAWHRLFPSPEMGGPMRKGEFIMSEMKQGIDKIRDIETDAPALAALED